MKSIVLRKHFQVAMAVAVLSLMWGCGSGGGSAPDAAVGKGATVTIISSGNAGYVVQGDNMDGVEGMELTISYDSSALSSPAIALGGLIPGGVMVTDTATAGTIRIAMTLAYPKVLSGSGRIATVSFASATGTGSVSLASVRLLDMNGEPVPQCLGNAL